MSKKIYVSSNIGDKTYISSSTNPSVYSSSNNRDKSVVKSNVRNEYTVNSNTATRSIVSNSEQVKGDKGEKGQKGDKGEDYKLKNQTAQIIRKQELIYKIARDIGDKYIEYNKQKQVTAVVQDGKYKSLQRTGNDITAYKVEDIGGVFDPPEVQSYSNNKFVMSNIKGGGKDIITGFKLKITQGATDIYETNEINDFYWTPVSHTVSTPGSYQASFKYKTSSQNYTPYGPLYNFTI